MAKGNSRTLGGQPESRVQRTRYTKETDLKKESLKKGKKSKDYRPVRESFQEHK